MKNNKLKAAAIKYSKENLEIPIISALGYGDFAKKIIEEAKMNGIKVLQDKNFFNFEELFIPGKEIPEDVYDIIASILAFILKTNLNLERK